ncbi:MAG: DeoR family transcriptional regulator, partial [Phycisphaerae bacterium]|nr:DeoR family transcriptional regulator [Phycisphaerae bacterium]
RESLPFISPESKNPPEAFTEGTLSFYNDRTELNGVVLLETGELGHAERLLRLLTTPTTSGRRPKLGGRRLQKALGGASQDAISSMVFRLRRKIMRQFRRDLNIRVGRHDVIATADGGGYLVPMTITAEDKTNDIEPPTSMASELIETGCNIRQHKIIEAICRAGQISRKEIQQLCGVSAKTAKRDLCFLRDKGLVEFVGYGMTGSWRLKDPTICQTIACE